MRGKNKRQLSQYTIEELKQLLVEYIIHIHKIAINVRYPDEPDTSNLAGVVRYRGDLEYIVERSFEIETWSKMATHFLYGIATKHPFVDGNKRTALLLGLMLILAESDSKKIVKIFRDMTEGTDKKVVRFMIELADKKHSFNEAEKFLKEIIS